MKGINKGSKNGKWNENIGYKGLHMWIKRNKPKSNLCESCGITPPNDLANISGKYLRDIKDFEWLCRKCHMIKDGRMGRRLQNGQFTRQML